MTECRERGSTGVFRAPGVASPLGSKYVGPNTRRNQASDDSGGPAGPSAPTLPLAPGSGGFLCEFPGCTRTFKTNKGRGVHHQRAHKDWYDARVLTVEERARWTTEEAAMLARKEAELLSLVPPPRFMNQELYKYFPRRTVEAIKGRRRRADHKNAVVAFLEMETLENHMEGEEDQEPIDEALLSSIESMNRPRNCNFRANVLHEIGMEARDSGKEATLQKIGLYLREIFPPPRTAREISAKKTHNPPYTNKKKARRHLYATTQKLWCKDRKRCVTNILEGLHSINQPPRTVMEPYWTTVMSTDSDKCPELTNMESIRDIWQPVAEMELKWGRVSKTSAPGPDGVSARIFRAIPSGVLVRLYNLLMWCRGLPEDIMISRTIFIPKKADASRPEEFRPISIPSVIVRGLHKILAKRLENMLNIDYRQRAFRSTDGCADNTFLLDTILRRHRKQYKSLYVASLDIRKAFDSVSHPAIGIVLQSAGVPVPMIQYLMNIYKGSTTRLEGEGWKSKPIHPGRGVRQGDPLSPVVFNVVTHCMLQTLPQEIGARLGNIPINAAAFADDLLLFAATPEGLQQLISKVSTFMETCGMAINVAKSLTISIKAIAHLKKTSIDASTTFKCNNQELPNLRRTNEWTYLGIRFSPEGRTKCRPGEVLKPLLDALTRAPLKPQQRMFALRTMVIPKLYHQLALGAVNIGILNKTDKSIRGTVRQWLALPHDVPTAYFHAAVRDGGLGIPSMRWTAPLHRRGRIISAKQTYLNQGLDQYAEEELRKCARRLTDDGTIYTTQSMLNDRWANKLYQSVDGGGLRESGNTTQQHQWVADGNRFLSGKDYINCLRIRISALPTRSRTARGTHKERRCRAGCMAQETLNHVLQQCHRTHAARIKRHNTVLNYIEKRIRRNGYEVFQEPHYKTALGLRKPDLVAVLGETAVVIDAQVVSEQTNLNQAHRKKANYYEEQAVTDEIRKEHGIRNVITTSATLSWKGVWSSDSVEHLKRLDFLRTGDLKIVASRVLIGGIAEYRIFNATTSTVNWRTGIG